MLAIARSLIQDIFFFKTDQDMKRIEILLAKAKGFYGNGDPGHGLAHIRRVMKNCELLSDNDDVDLEVLLAAAAQRLHAHRSSRRGTSRTGRTSKFSPKATRPCSNPTAASWSTPPGGRM
jgi:hypothetical protein